GLSNRLCRHSEPNGAISSKSIQPCVTYVAALTPIPPCVGNPGRIYSDPEGRPVCVHATPCWYRWQHWAASWLKNRIQNRNKLNLRSPSSIILRNRNLDRYAL